MTGQDGTTDRPIGRRPGNPEHTRTAILEAARQTFATAGFDRATIRSIATAADVDPALVMHYFRTKQNLFVAAHSLPFHPAELFETALDLPPAERGEHIARVYLSMFAIPSSGAVSLMRAAASNEEAARMLREFVTDALLAHAAEIAPGPDAQRRVALAASHLIGAIFVRQIIGLGALQSASVDELVEAIAPAIQTYLEPR